MIMVKANAKINVALNVLEKREDGYHQVDMVMLPLELHDRVEVELLPVGYDTFITCDDISVPTDESNLTMKAFQVLKEHYHLRQNFRIHVHKVIPISAGLAGGSADAAAVMKSVLKIAKISATREELIALATKVGADVPFCLFNEPARVRGIGEQLEAISVKKKYFALIVKPKAGIMTAHAYADYDDLEEKESSNLDRLVHGLSIGNEVEIAEEMKNGLEKPAIAKVPEIAAIKKVFHDEGLPMCLMSGSGSAVYALSTEEKKLQKVMKKFEGKGYYIKLTSIL